MLVVESVVVSDNVTVKVGNIWFRELAVFGLCLRGEFLPLLLVFYSVLGIVLKESLEGTSLLV